MYGIAANKAKRHYRTLERRRRAHARAAGREHVWLDPDPDDRLDAQRRAPELATAIRGMRSRDREVLLLYGLAELTYAEIGEALDIPVGTVRSRLSRSRRRLGNYLEASGQIAASGAPEQGEVSDGKPE